MNMNELELVPGKYIGENKPTFVIAEIGQNHNGKYRSILNSIIPMTLIILTKYFLNLIFQFSSLQGTLEQQKNSFLKPKNAARIVSSFRNPGKNDIKLSQLKFRGGK